MAKFLNSSINLEGVSKAGKAALQKELLYRGYKWVYSGRSEIDISDSCKWLNTDCGGMISLSTRVAASPDNIFDVVESVEVKVDLREAPKNIELNGKMYSKKQLEVAIKQLEEAEINA